MKTCSAVYFMIFLVFCGAQTTQSPEKCEINKIPVQANFDESRVSKYCTWTDKITK